MKYSGVLYVDGRISVNRPLSCDKFVNNHFQFLFNRPTFPKITPGKAGTPVGSLGIAGVHLTLLLQLMATWVTEVAIFRKDIN